MGEGGGVGRSICWWTGKEDFWYGISRFLEKYVGKRNFQHYTVPAITAKNNEKSGFEIIKNSIMLYCNMQMSTYFYTSFILIT